MQWKLIPLEGEKHEKEHMRCDAVICSTFEMIGTRRRCTQNYARVINLGAFYRLRWLYREEYRLNMGKLIENV